MIWRSLNSTKRQQQRNCPPDPVGGVESEEIDDSHRQEDRPAEVRIDDTEGVQEYVLTLALRCPLDIAKEIYGQ